MIKEGHHTVVNIQADYDTDHGPDFTENKQWEPEMEEAQ